MGVGGQCHTPAALPLGRDQYPLYRRLGGLQGQFGWVQKISSPLGFDPRTVQPIASHYTDYAIPVYGEYTTRRKYNLLITEIMQLINLKVKHLV
jgi:hypothetical protein